MNTTTPDVGPWIWVIGIAVILIFILLLVLRLFLMAGACALGIAAYFIGFIDGQVAVAILIKDSFIDAIPPDIREKLHHPIQKFTSEIDQAIFNDSMKGVLLFLFCLVLLAFLLVGNLRYKRLKRETGSGASSATDLNE